MVPLNNMPDIWLEHQALEEQNCTRKHRRRAFIYDPSAECDMMTIVTVREKQWNKNPILQIFSIENGNLKLSGKLEFVALKPVTH